MNKPTNLLTLIKSTYQPAKIKRNIVLLAIALVGSATGHQLIDGGGITVPGARLYDNDGHWFWEGEGVTPDFAVWDDPNILMQGRDPQIERVVAEVLKLLESNPPEVTPAPPREDRTAGDLSGS